MPDHVAPHPDLAGYVLGALDDAERAAFEAHLADCDACRAEVAELEGLPALLEAAALPVEVPAGLRERTFGAVERAASSRQRRSRLAWAAVTVAAAAVLGLGVVATGVLGQRGTTTQVALSSPTGAAAHATATVRRSGANMVVDLDVANLPPNPPGTFYECWFVNPGGDSVPHPDRVSAGTFVVGPSGHVKVHMVTAAVVARFPVMGVTLEPDDGNPARTGNKVLTSKPITLNRSR